MSSGIKQQITRNLLNIPGWRTKRKIVVIESDDWGSIRMPSKQVYEKLLQKGISLNNLPYNRYDSLASENDLSALFDVLSTVKDKNGNPAIMTANTIVANPDFTKIKDSEFTEYFYELFTDTLKRYPKHGKSFDLWKEGINTSVFYPQFHGREHLNVRRWMRALQNNIGNIRLGFDNEMFDLSDSLHISENSFMDSFKPQIPEDIEFIKHSIQEGLIIFENLFGFTSSSFIAPNYIWDQEIESELAKCGVKYIQGMAFQHKPIPGKLNKTKTRYHYLGQKNKNNQRYLIRNCYFEPGQNEHFDWVNDCLNRIQIAFRWGKPAIIASHRLNFIGFIDPSNRDRGLTLLKELLQKIVKKWPDVEFMTSDQLGELINNVNTG